MAVARALVPWCRSGVAAWAAPQQCRALSATADSRLSRQERQRLSRRALESQELRPWAGRGCVDHNRTATSFPQAKLIKYIGILGRKRHWEKALEVFNTMKQPATTILRAAVVAACTHAPDPKHAQAQFDAMPEKTLAAYNAMIVMHARQQRFAEARSLLDSLRKDQLEPNVTTYGSLIAGHALVGDTGDAVAVLDEMESAGVQPSAIAFGAAMGSCTRTSDTTRAEALIRRMESQGIVPNLVHMTSLLTTYASRGDEGRALGVFEDMKRRQLQPDVVAYTSLLNCFCSRDALPRAEQLWAEMQAQPWKPTAFSYNAMLRIVARAEAVDRFYELLKELDERGIRRNRQIQASCKLIQALEDKSQGRFPGLRGPPKEELWPPSGGPAEHTTTG